MPKPTKSSASTTPRNGAVARALELIESGQQSVRGACAQTGANRSTVRHHLRRRGWTPGSASGSSGAASPAKQEGVEFTTNTDGSITASAPGKTPAQVLRAHGLNPDDYVELSVRITDGGTADKPVSWVRVNARRKSEMFRIPDLGSFEPRPYAPGPTAGTVYRVAFLADPHNPFMDEACFRACLSYLRHDEGISQVVHLGDAGNHGHIARHRKHRRYGEFTRETCKSVARYFYDATKAKPAAQHIFIPGNHDDRIHYYVEDNADEFTAFTPPPLPNEPEDSQEPIITFNTFYRLADLGVELIDEDWKLAHFPVVRELSARHGYLTGNNAERKLLETHGKSQVHGHLHRGEMVYRTKHDPLDIRVAMSVPTLAQVKSDGLGYQPDPDWTPGMAVAEVYEDESFVLSICPFIENELRVPGIGRFRGEE